MPYINPISENDGKKWKVILGLPYGTSIWQTGDARSKNGQYKKHLPEKDRGIGTEKETVQFPFWNQFEQI